MMYDGQLPVSLLDLVLPRVFLDPEKFVVIFAFGFLELEFGMVDVFLNTRLVGIRFVDGFEFANGLVPGTGFTESAGAGFASFGVGGIKGKGAIAVGNGGFVVFELL